MEEHEWKPEPNNYRLHRRYERCKELTQEENAAKMRNQSPKALITEHVYENKKYFLFIGEDRAFPSIAGSASAGSARPIANMIPNSESHTTGSKNRNPKNWINTTHNIGT
jgi:hypothetical protein